jgi:hypothetical protein
MFHPPRNWFAECRWTSRARLRKTRRMTVPGQAPTPQIRTPERWTAGVYANGMGVWSTQTEVTLDFFVNLPPEQGAGQTGDPVILAPQEVVARVKMPPSLLFQVMRNLAAAQDQYEAQFGAIPDHQGQTFQTQADGEIGGQNA